MDKNMKKWQSLKGEEIIRGLLVAGLLVLIVLVGPLNVFYGGFESDESVAPVEKAHITGYWNLGEQDFEGRFIPSNNHFAGMEIILGGIPEEGISGQLSAVVLDETGKIAAKAAGDLSTAKEGEWFYLKTDKPLKTGRIYTVRLHAEGCEEWPQIPLVETAFQPDEHLEGGALMIFGYQKPVLALDTRILICLIATALCLILVAPLAGKKQEMQQLIRGSGFVLLLAMGLSWNYMYNSFDSDNLTFRNFQVDSENLVYGPLMADRRGQWRSTGFGLSRYEDAQGILEEWDEKGVFESNDEWTEGYNHNWAAIVLKNTGYLEKTAVEGNHIRFANGDVLRIIGVNRGEVSTSIYLEHEGPLDHVRYGSLRDIVILASDGQTIARDNIVPYLSQFGLQGKIFRRLGRFFSVQDEKNMLALFCSVMMAMTAMAIVLIVREKYDCLMAGCFYLVFLLSPWVVNFARNLYWVEFTWFLPMAVGAFCAWKIEDKKCRLLSYAGAFMTICTKSLCGYEYISTIMMGLIIFLVSDLLVAAINGNRKKVALLVRTIVIIGVAAVLGFVVAIAFHAQWRGNGSLTQGLRIIYEQDVVRRTRGASMNGGYDSITAEDAEATRVFLAMSGWQVVCRYFHFAPGTQIVTGLDGNLFSLICLAPLAICWHDWKKNACKAWGQLALYGVSFLATMSWHILAKNHSAVHVHINYVLWYFGFVQICLYIILRKLIEVIKNK